MASPFTAPAKISQPRSGDVLLRTRLFKLLDRQAVRPVTWVTGPAGAGKTTLVASYLRDRAFPCLWYQVDEGDADIATFFFYMGLAARKAAPRTSRSLPLLTPEYQSGIPTFTRRYFEVLFGILRRSGVLVLDNYHEVPPRSPFHEVILNGLLAAPTGARVIIISRGGPPPAFSRLEANKLLHTVGWDQLRLTPNETSAVVRLHSGRNPPKELLRFITERTAGWAAGVILMDTLYERSGRGDGPDATVPGKLFDYFAGEIFEKLDAATRDFLLKTAYLPRMTPRMAGAISDNGRARVILESLSRGNYFTEQRSGPETTYQYHALFRTFLKRTASQTYTAAVQSRLHLAAATLLEESGQVEDAAELFRGARAWERLARLILVHAAPLVRQGRNRTVEEWLTALPGAVRGQSPWLLYWAGVCRFPYDITEAREHFEKSFRLFRAENDSTGLYLSWCGVVNAYVYTWGDVTPLDKWIAVFRSLNSRDRKFPSPEIEAQVATSMFIALMYRQPHHPDLPRWRRKVNELMQRSADHNQQLAMGSHFVLYCTWVGELTAAGTILARLKAVERSAAISPFNLIVWRGIEAAYHWFRAQDEQSRRAVRQGLELADRSGIHLWDFMLLAQGSYSTLTLGERELAGKYLERMALALDSNRLLDRSHYHYHMTLYFLAGGDVPRAKEHSRLTLQLVGEAGTPIPLALALIASGEVLFESGAVRQAVDSLSRARKIGKGMKSRHIEFKCLLLHSWFTLKRGRRAECHRHLRNAMALGRENGYVNTDGWRHDVMTGLCIEALEHGIEASYVRDLIAKRSLVPSSPPYHIDAWPWPLAVLTLGSFEIRTNGMPLTVSKKTQKKPLQLLKALIASGGRDVREDYLADLLWPEAEGDAGRKALGVNVIRLRRLLGVRDAVLAREGLISLNPRLCWIDAWAFERLFAPAEIERGGRKGEGRKRDRRIVLNKALALYRGPFLPGEFEPWAVPLREKLRDKCLQYIDILGMDMERSKKWREAIRLYQRGLDVDDLAETYYQRIIHCYLRLGRRAEALAVFHRLQKTFAAYGVEPSEDTKKLVALIRK